MTSLKLIAASALLLLAACGERQALTATDAQYRPPLGATGIGVAYLTLESAKADRITGVSSPQAASVEIHATVTENGMGRMQKLETLELPAGKPVVFEPGGLHIMVFEPQPVATSPGATFPLEFVLESGATKIVPLVVGTGAAGGN